MSSSSDTKKRKASTESDPDTKRAKEETSPPSPPPSSSDTKINYVLIDKTKTDGFDLLYSKIQPFKLWEPHYFRIGNDFTFYYTPDEENPVDMDFDEVQKRRKEGTLWPKDSKPVRIVQERVTDRSTRGYLYGSEKKANLDEVDKAFVAETTPCEKLEFYGLHTYGGYYGFFRPDLNEVMVLISPIITDERLKTIERVYVTTEPHPSDKGSDCYDSEHDRHKAKTTVYIVPSATDTGLFGCMATRIGDVSSELFTLLKNAETKVRPVGRMREGSPMTEDTVQLFKIWNVHGLIDPNTAWITTNNNCNDVLVVTYNNTSNNGLLFIENKGVWSVSGSNYPWRTMQDLDLLPSFRDDGTVKLESLK